MTHIRPTVLLALILAALALAATSAARAQEATFFDELEVRRIEIPIRILDHRGRVLRGLTPDDVVVLVDGIRVEAEALDWVEDAAPASAPLLRPVELVGPVEAPPPGRLIVLFFQLDFDRSRLPGLVRMAQQAEHIADSVGPTDRVAVLTFNHHLELHLDLTADRELIRQAVRPSSLFDKPGDPSTPDEPSLLPHYDAEAAHRACHPDNGLKVTAEAMEHLPGAKTVVFLGWGMGRFSRTGVHMRHGYGEARRALARAGASVFTLDVTEADYHSLELGLRQVARDTGGFYARTHLFAIGAMNRLIETISGHYVVVLQSPTEERGHHSLDLRLRGHRGEILAPSFFVD